MTGGPNLVMESDDEVVAGPGGAYVQQTETFGRLHDLLIDLQVIIPIGGHAAFDLQLRTAVTPQHLHTVVTGGAATQTGEEDDGKLKSFRPVDRHHPHRVVIRFRKHNLHRPYVLSTLQFHPRQVLAEISPVGIRELPSLVGHESKSSPHVPRAALVEGQLEKMTLLDPPLHEPADVAPPALLVQIA